MRSRQLLLTVFAGVFSLIVVVGAIWNPRSNRNSTMSVAIAVTRDLDSGTELTADMLATVAFPEQHLPSGAITDTADLLGKILRSPVQRNQLVYPGNLLEEDSRQALQSKIPEGHCAYSIQLNSASAGLAGFALPGSRVNVLSHAETQRGQESGASDLVVENVLILAVDDVQNPDKVSTNPKSMTLLVTLEQSTLVDAAQSRGPLRLALRNGADQTPPKPESPPTVPVPVEEDDSRLPAGDHIKPRRRRTEFSVLVMRGPTTAASPVRASKVSLPSITLQSVPGMTSPSR